ncbi:MAG TPA: FRG domain-containing protein, partial [Gaiellaceae bacterium]|nr:FRG domain-containing protein [Gaiellaceae bacterium]
VRAESWGHLQELLYEESWQEELGRFRSDRVFRGQQDSASDLTTSLTRLGGDYGRLERHLLRNFRKYAHRDTRYESFWDWLSVAKHHGLPTRVLDWTHSPFVALHFATASPSAYDRDGVVWSVDYVRAAQHLPQSLRRILDEEGSNSFTTEMVDAAAASLAELDALAEDDDFVVFLEPPSLDERIVNQYALFSLMSSAQARLDEWLDARPGLGRRIVIPAELKWEVRDKLDQANVTERVLFPGLDGIARWLRRHYSSRA